MDSVEEKRARQRETVRRYRERQKALGVKPPKRNETQKAHLREYMRRRRASAKERGEVLPSETWWRRNPEAHRARVNAWRANNLEYRKALDREAQERRRSTPWGRINNNLVPILHWAVRRAHKGTQAGEKYIQALGYTWAELRAHLEAQFRPGMTFGNWGEIWELDHIVPLSTFQYTSLDDPLFREAWALSNLRPLLTAENATKGARRPP